VKNVADTEAYSTFDHVFSKTVRSLSSVIGLKRVTQPFWNRWRASGVSDDVIFEFLDGVGTIDNWAFTAERVVARRQREFANVRATLTVSEQVTQLRQLSYLCHMAQWGCLPITDQRRALYTMVRDYYIDAETLAYGDLYRRVMIPWKAQQFPGNLHQQQRAAPLIVIVHGIDGCKEEHLATELGLYNAGFSTLCFDGPGQSESLLLNDIVWDADFHASVSAAIDAVCGAPGVDPEHIGALGISIGGMWALKAAAHDSRIRAVFDLGGPLHTRNFPALPFLIKTRLCQVTGARTRDEIDIILRHNNIESPDVLTRIEAAVRICHGSRDRVVSTADKQWLLQQLHTARPRRDASLRIIDGGDHCCTGQFDTVREDAIEFFTRCFPAVTAAPSER
jgi:pimeloyl-ACP methyl ester carboxylesterase